VRDYQFEIVKAALFENTLVSLPTGNCFSERLRHGRPLQLELNGFITGMGKTFIAAVVMYNFHRWYPNDLIVFMAPTRPLVSQQLEACHNTVGIHPTRTVELTGQVVPSKRAKIWKTKSVFFLTPQVMMSDLLNGSCPAEKVRCVVVDEAHKAVGEHAYAQVISTLSKTNPLFRVLALSATPGRDLPAVKQVLRNLLISRVELRAENSTDVMPYTHEKDTTTIVTPLDDYLQSVYDRLLDVSILIYFKTFRIILS
jgi:Fanconi anemia group M protein